MTITERLAAADRPSVLRFLSAVINELTILARSVYDHPESHARLVETNEAIHRLSGHLRDLSDPQESVTASRAQAAAAELGLLSDTVISRILAHSSL